MPLPFLGSVAAGHQTIRFLFFFLLLFSGWFTFFCFFPGETKSFNNFLTIFWQLFDNFLTTFLTTFANFFDYFFFDCGRQLPQQIGRNKFHIRCAYTSLLITPGLRTIHLLLTQHILAMLNLMFLTTTQSGHAESEFCTTTYSIQAESDVIYTTHSKLAESYVFTLSW
jgi:hypothetical protein